MFALLAIALCGALADVLLWTTPGVSAELAVDAVGVLSAAAIVLAAVHFAPRTPVAWFVLSGSALAFTLVGVFYQVASRYLSSTPALELVPTALELTGFGLILWAVLVMVRSSTGHQGWGTFIDSAIVFVALGVLSWELVIQPYFAQNKFDTGPLIRLATASYPVLDVVIAVLLLRLVVLTRRAPIALWAVFASILLGFWANLGTVIAATHGNLGNLTFSITLWSSAVTLLGIAALCPSMRILTEPANLRRSSSGVRAVALWLAFVAVPVTLAIRVGIGADPFEWPEWVIPTALLSALIIYRLQMSLRANERAQRHAEVIIEHLTDSILEIDQSGRVVFQSPSVVRMLGHRENALLGESRLDLVDPSDLSLAEALFNRALEEPASRVTGQLRGLDADEQTRHFEISLTNLLSDPDVGTIVAVLHDVTAQRRYESELEYHASHDGLTALPNRSAVHERLEGLSGRMAGTRGLAVVCAIDLDNFKDVNDSLGHLAGDSVMRSVAERLRRNVRPGDTVGRVGGDEFVIVAEDLDSLERAHSMLERIESSLREPYFLQPDIASVPVGVSASIGVVVVSAGQGSEEVLRDADLALYQAKANGKGCRQLFHPSMRERALERIALESDLARASYDDELLLQYQPIIDLRTLKVTGAEALLRWRHPTQGLIMPERFIPLAEHNGSIVAIGLWVLRHACAQAAAWQHAGVGRSVSVNVSVRQIEREDFIAELRAVLNATGLAPELLVLEVTESALSSDGRVMLRQLSAIRDMGVRVAIDDFGTGYSSLSYLHSIPADVVKIDQSFVSGLADGADDPLVRTIVHLTEQLGMSSVAEGIESAGQLRRLRSYGCVRGQGHLFAHALDAIEFEAFERSWETRGSPLGPGPGTHSWPKRTSAELTTLRP